VRTGRADIDYLLRQTAFPNLLETLRLFNRIADPVGKAASLANLGEIEHQLGDLDEAMEFLTGALLLQHHATAAEVLPGAAAAVRVSRPIRRVSAAQPRLHDPLWIFEVVQ
jgi:hypothetical protein